jgi:hypothetical protein
MEIVPISLEEANLFVEQHHRHHDPVTGHKFSIGLAHGETVHGVAIVGRPVSRMLDNGWTLEVNRCCTDGTRNACSMLYRAAWRAAKSYGLPSIDHLHPAKRRRLAGFMLVGERGGGQWTRKSRPRIDTAPTQAKWLWELTS